MGKYKERLALLMVLAVCVCGILSGCTNGTVSNVSVSSGAASKSTVPVEKKKAWGDVSSFVCYYGKFNPDMLKFDVAILESTNLTAAEIKKVNDAGTYTIGYLTIGEDDQLEKGDGKGPGGYASYYFNKDGMPAKNGDWNSYFVNAGNVNWQNKVIQKAKQILDKGCQGLFLDTIDTAGGEYADTADGMIALIKKLHETYPNAKLVANRGLSLISSYIPYVSGIMYEDFSSSYDFDKKQYINLGNDDLENTGTVAVNCINAARKVNDVPVFALDYALPSSKENIQKYYDRSWEYNFIPYVSTINLDEVYVHNIQPKSQKGVKADIGEGSLAVIDPSLPAPNKDKSNLALASNGGSVIVDSIFETYGFKTLNDGYRNEPKLHWSKAAWASSETSKEHWIQIKLSQKKIISDIKIIWALDNHEIHSSQDIIIQNFVGDVWKDIKKVTNIPSGTEISDIKIDPQETQNIRILQPKGRGSKSRANLMWVAEVEVY